MNETNKKQLPGLTLLINSTPKLSYETTNRRNRGVIGKMTSSNFVYISKCEIPSGDI